MEKDIYITSTHFSHRHTPVFFILSLLCLAGCLSVAAQPTSFRDELVLSTPELNTDVPFSPEPKRSRLVYTGEDGRLVYRPYSDRGDIIPDFSGVGYRKGERELPTVPVRVTLAPSVDDSDDTARIQQAIDAVGAMPPDVDGFRGAVLLQRGRYRVGDTLIIRESGVVLRGEGSCENGTILYADAPRRYNVISVGRPTGSRQEVEGTRQKVIDAYVPVGSRTLTVADGSPFSVSDTVVVGRPATQEWIDMIGMGPDGDMARRGGQPWLPEEYTFSFEREIVAVDGNSIVLDIPLVQSLDQDFGGGFVYRYIFPERIQDIGVEHLRIVSAFDRSQTGTLSGRNLEGPGDPARHGEVFYSDGEHARNAVAMDMVEHAWVRNVAAQWFSYAAVTISRRSAHVTVIDCAYLDGAGPVSGGQRYAFNISGQKNLVRDSYAFRARHSFVLSARVPGPNVFYNCRADEAILMSEPHHRWATGVLFDNIKHYGGSLWAVNRGTSGTGHGWSGAQIIFWNCTAALIAVQSPPMAENFAIGLGGTPDRRPIDLTWLRRQSGEELPKRPETPAHGSGHIEHPHNPVEPPSLYLRQLEERMSAKQ